MLISFLLDSTYLALPLYPSISTLGLRTWAGKASPLAPRLVQ